jgi:hypothetical protein
MTHRTGRNDPCPCGSGRKYKHCCLEHPRGEDPSSAVPRALAWLESRHARAVREAIDDALFVDLDDDDLDDFGDLDDDIREFIIGQTYEWLLAEGEISVRGELRRVADLLLGTGGPTFSDTQRAWLTQLATTPLRLYTVTDVKPQRSMTVCDVLDPDAEPVIVAESMGSKADLLGSTIGLRVIREKEAFVLSGTMYVFVPMQVSKLLRWIRETSEPGQEPPASELSFMIRRVWLMQFFENLEPPTLMDAYSNEPLLFVTDRYRVRDWTKVAATLATQSDVEGNPEQGWERRIDCDDAQIRSAAAITRTRDGEHLTVFYRTQHDADDGRHWFDAIMGDAVEFRIRDIHDPVGVLGHMGDNAPPAPGMADVPPELATSAIRQALLRIYADWADEPLPILNERSPREAIVTPAGLERVKGLLRAYQHDENRQAEMQQRDPVSFQFLWDALGLAPE